jgi:hypothetical protein
MVWKMLTLLPFLLHISSYPFFSSFFVLPSDLFLILGRMPHATVERKK